MKLKTQIVIIALALGVSTSLVSSQDTQPRQLGTAGWSNHLIHGEDRGMMRGQKGSTRR